MSTPRAFLAAEWRLITMANYAVDPALLAPLVPRGVELDTHGGQTFVSLVAFLFLRTRVLGLSIPWHKHFEELNLRFYVRRTVNGEVRRGVVFIKEIVPRWAVARMAWWTYNENYAAMPMRHCVMSTTWGDWAGLLRHAPSAELTACGARAPFSLEYGWRTGNRWNSLKAEASGELMPLAPGSHAEFVAEHYYGYCRQRNGGTIEYGVEHRPWCHWRAERVALDCDIAGLYGPEFVETLSQPPFSAFIADGSAVVVRRPVRIA